MVSEENEKYRIMFLEFFLDPSSYPEFTTGVKKIETHASYVFLTDSFAYKIKKNVNYGFLDFSTLEKRKYYTEQELLLNRRLCSDIYIGVMPVWKSGLKISLEDGDEIIEYALKMHRMSDEDFFLERLKNDKITDDDIDEIARLISEFYKKEKSSPEISQWGAGEKIKITTDENFEQTKNNIDFSISGPSYEIIKHYTNQFFARNGELFRKRMNEGWIRNCHGDMHLDHFHKHGNKWCIFDCIEFNERFRYTDIACDLAFLLMDLDYNRRNDLAHSLCDKINSYLPDPDRRKIMDFYRCYRAYVRGKVESMIASNVPNNASALNLAKRYFHLSLQYALVGSDPFAIIFMGRIASGKSRLAKRFSEEAEIEVFSCDARRKELAGIPLFERTPESRKKEIYSREFSEKTYSSVIDSAILHMRTGRPAIIDCTFSGIGHRNSILHKLSDHNIPCIFIEATAPAEIIKERLRKRALKDDVVSDARLEDFEKINAGYENPDELTEDLLIKIDTTKNKDTTYFECGKMLVEVLGNRTQ